MVNSAGLFYFLGYGMSSNYPNRDRLSNLSFSKLCFLCDRLGISPIPLLYQFDYKFLNVLRKEHRPETVKGSWFSSIWRANNSAPDILKESTYNGCIDFELHPAKQMLVVVMWDGNSFNGQREMERCKWEIKVDDSMSLTCKELCYCMVMKIQEHAKKQHEENLRKQSLEAIDKVIGQYLQ